MDSRAAPTYGVVLWPGIEQIICILCAQYNNFFGFKNGGNVKCLKCNSTMSNGFIVDYMAGGKRQVEKWNAGEPKPSFWHGVDIKNQSQIEVVTYRCDECGYLESYASKPK